MSNLVAIIRDGKSDFLILEKFLKTLLSHHKKCDTENLNFYEFEDLRITNPINKLLTNKITDREFIDEIASSLFVAVTKLYKEIGEVTNRDILVLNGDSEKLLVDPKIYFEDWAYKIHIDIWKAIEYFYEQMSSQGYAYIDLPLIIPVILFPSSEILIAASENDFIKEQYRNLKPNPDLKQKIFGSSNIPELIQSGKIRDVIDNAFVTEKLNIIYRNLPELKKVFHILSHNYN